MQRAPSSPGLPTAARLPARLRSAARPTSRPWRRRTRPAFRALRSSPCTTSSCLPAGRRSSLCCAGARAGKPSSAVCCLPTPAAGFLHGPHPALTCSPSQRAGMPDCSYFQGKRDAERRLAELYPQGGVALRPGIISGTRQVVPPAPACHLQPASTCALPAGWDLPYCEQRRCSLLR